MVDLDRPSDLDDQVPGRLTVELLDAPLGALVQVGEEVFQVPAIALGTGLREAGQVQGPGRRRRQLRPRQVEVHAAIRGGDQVLSPVSVHVLHAEPGDTQGLAEGTLEARDVADAVVHVRLVLDLEALLEVSLVVLQVDPELPRRGQHEIQAAVAIHVPHEPHAIDAVGQVAAGGQVQPPLAEVTPGPGHPGAHVPGAREGHHFVAAVPLQIDNVPGQVLPGPGEVGVEVRRVGPVGPQIAVAEARGLELDQVQPPVTIHVAYRQLPAGVGDHHDADSRILSGGGEEAREDDT